ncbi:hypothetical protein [Streptomyces sp. NPDC060002]|uniref:hypothetical protein n=1 Tax=Streptomyces sp. NPDC060002 TaxID=3347033 RepID=UPI0036A20B1C
MSTRELVLRDVIAVKDEVHAGNFKIALSQGFSETDARVAEYVVVDGHRLVTVRTSATWSSRPTPCSTTAPGARAVREVLLGIDPPVNPTRRAQGCLKKHGSASWSEYAPGEP